jgi:capsular polysaccharide biosynthesis protein
LYAWDVMTALRRRWKILIAGLLLTAIAALLAMRILPPTYQATGSVIFISPAITTDGSASDPTQPANPYLNFGTPLAATADVVSASVNSDTTANRLSAAGATGTYQVALDPNSDAPLMSVEATARDSAKAVKTRDIVINEIRRELAEIQQASGAPVAQLIRAQTVTVSDNAPRVHGSLVRALAVILAVGVVLSCGCAVAAEGISRGRKRADAEKAGLGAETPEGTPVEDEAVSRTPSGVTDSAAGPGLNGTADRERIKATVSRTTDS